MLKVPSYYRVGEYELSDVLVKIDGDVEREIGIVFHFGDGFEAMLSGHGYVSRGGFKIFNTKQEAIDSLIDTYESLEDRRHDRGVLK